MGGDLGANMDALGVWFAKLGTGSMEHEIRLIELGRAAWYDDHPLSIASRLRQQR